LGYSRDSRLIRPRSSVSMRLPVEKTGNSLLHRLVREAAVPEGALYAG